MSDKVYRIRAEGQDVDIKLVDLGDGTYAWKTSGGAGGGGGAIGGAITGGGANRVLYEDASQNLAASANLAYDGSTLTVTAGSAVSKGIISKNFASQTANNFEAQSSGGTPYFYIGPDVLAGDSATKNFFNITATLPTVSTVQANAINFLITGAGSSTFIQRALFVQFLAGYTGASSTTAVVANNASAGTGTTALSAASGNIGINASAIGVTAGNNTGNISTASGSTSLNMGARFSAVTTASTLGVGVSGFALTATTNVAGFFGLMNTAPSLATSAAIVADNGATAADIFRGRNNGTLVCQIDSTGGIVSSGTVTCEALNLQDSGAAATIGEATLVGGTVTVSTTAVLTGDKVFCQRKTAGGTIGMSLTYTIVSGTSFTLTSDNILDTSTYSWAIIKVH